MLRFVCVILTVIICIIIGTKNVSQLCKVMFTDMQFLVVAKHSNTDFAKMKNNCLFKFDTVLLPSKRQTVSMQT